MEAAEKESSNGKNLSVLFVPKLTTLACFPLHPPHGERENIVALARVLNGRKKRSVSKMGKKHTNGIECHKASVNHCI